MVIKKVGLIANVAKEKSPACTIALYDWLVARGLDVTLEEGIAAKIGAGRGVDVGILGSLVDLLVVFGGDGTILRTARLIRDRDVPIVGINLGVFGYLTEVNLGEMFNAPGLDPCGGFPDRKEDDARCGNQWGRGNLPWGNRSQ
jgi:NAD+ kinase